VIDTPKPQYAQIAELLRSRIADGSYARGVPLPSEDKLGEELGVSRVTINRALGLLRSSGDVKVRRGAGTIVRSLPRIRRDARARYAAREQGTNLRSQTQYRQIGRVAAPSAVAKILGLDEGAPTLLRSRVLYANGEPTQMADSYFPWSLAEDCPALLEEDTGRGGSYSRLADVGYAPERFTEEIIGRAPTDAERQMLDLEATQHVLELWHVTYATGDRPVEACIHVMPMHLWSLRYDWQDRSHVAKAHE
jgi:GntR family transcriptional regulator